MDLSALGLTQMPRDPSYQRPPQDPDRPGPRIVAEITPLEGQAKMGEVQGFKVLCDEASDGRTGGTDLAPTPLGYFTAAIGF